MENQDFGKRLKQLRKQRGFTQKELSNLTGLSVSAVNKYETGQRKCSFKNAALIADALNIPFADLVIFWDDKEAQEEYTAKKELKAINALLESYGRYFVYGAEGFYLLGRGKKVFFSDKLFREFINSSVIDLAVTLGRYEERAAQEDGIQDDSDGE